MENLLIELEEAFNHNFGFKLSITLDNYWKKMKVSDYEEVEISKE